MVGRSAAFPIATRAAIAAAVTTASATIAARTTAVATITAVAPVTTRFARFAGRTGVFQLGAGFLVNHAHRQADFAARVDLEHLDLDLLAFLDNVGRLFNALVPHFGDDEALQGLKTEEIAEDRLVLVATAERAASIRLEGGRLKGRLMVYAPGTSYGAEIAMMLARHGVTIDSAPVCESASAEALLAQAQAGFGAAWIPRLLLAADGLVRCDMPAFFDAPYKVLLVRPGK